MANLTSILEKQNSLEAMLTKQCLDFEAILKTSSEVGNDVSLKQLHADFLSRTDAEYHTHLKATDC